MNNLSFVQQIAVWALPILFAITVHEVAHGWVANKLGDPTAKMLGRLTLNPVKHIDPIGTILIPLLLLYTAGFAFGWAKPVPITWQNLKQPKRDISLVALAGPGANLLMAIFWGLFAKFIGILLPGEPILVYMGHAGIIINLVLMVFNLVPIPPLDGSRVVSTFLKGKAAWYYHQIERYGFIILIILLATGIMGKLIGPIINNLYSILRNVIGA